MPRNFHRRPIDRFHLPLQTVRREADAVRAKRVRQNHAAPRLNIALRHLPHQFWLRQIPFIDASAQLRAQLLELSSPSPIRDRNRSPQTICKPHQVVSRTIPNSKYIETCESRDHPVAHPFRGEASLRSHRRWQAVAVHSRPSPSSVILSEAKDLNLASSSALICSSSSC